MRTNLIVNMFLAFLIAPFISLYMVAEEFEAQSGDMTIPVQTVNESIGVMRAEIDAVGMKIQDLDLLAQSRKDTFVVQSEQLTNLSKESVRKKNLSDDIYEQKILKMLGPAVEAHISNNTEIKIFKLDELGYRGFIAKVKLFNPKSFKVTLGKDQLGELETTSNAASRKGAILAINGGGFYKESRDGKSYAQLIGNTMIDGKLVEPFNGYPGDLFFAGVTKSGKVVGNVPTTENELKGTKAHQGVSFIPVLLKNGSKAEIPSKWKKSKQPRTIIGRYANDDLILIVVDGRQGEWSSGVTLERLQEKLLELGVQDAFNLDGGGSSSMYYNGRVLNKPSDGNERPVVNNILVLP